MNMYRVFATFALALAVVLTSQSALAHQGTETEIPPGVGVETLGRVAAGATSNDLTVLRVTLEPGASLPPFAAAEAAVIVIERGRLGVELRSGNADLTLAGGGAATPLTPGTESLLTEGDTVSFSNDASIAISSRFDTQTILHVSLVLVADAPVFAQEATGSFSVATVACPAGMTMATLDPAACAFSTEPLVQWSLASDQFAAPLGPDEATVNGPTTTWDGLPVGTYYVELTAESFAPGFSDYYIPSSNQVTRQDERTTRLYYDMIRSSGPIRVFVFAEEAAATRSGAVSVEVHNCPPGTLLPDIQVTPCAEPVEAITIELSCFGNEPQPLTAATREDETFTWSGLPFGPCYLQIGNLPDGHGRIYIYGDSGPTETYDGTASHPFVTGDPGSVSAPPVHLVVYLVDAATATDGDGDGLPDADEITLGTDPTNRDSDGDQSDDWSEVRFGTDPLDPTSAPG